MAKQTSTAKRINLLQPELVPPKQHLTLTSMVILWLIVLGGFLIAESVVETMLLKEKRLNQRLKAEQQQLSEVTVGLQQKLAESKIDSALQSQLDATLLLLNDKKSLYQKLSAQEGELVDGFSQFMSELARFHHRQIMLSQILVTDNHISIKGVASKAEYVPNWLSGFEQSHFLKHKRFGGFKILGQEQGVIFAVSTDADVELDSNTSAQSNKRSQTKQEASDVNG